MARPTIQTLKSWADRLDVKMPDLVNFPEDDERAALIDCTRSLPIGVVRRWLREAQEAGKGRAERAEHQ